MPAGRAPSPGRRAPSPGRAKPAAAKRPGSAPSKSAKPSYTQQLAVIERELTNQPPTDIGTRPEDSAWLAENARQPGVVVLPSGLQYEELETGEPGAASPQIDTPCECHYCGILLDGDEEFDSSYARGSPATLAPNKVIQGWTIAMQCMGVGDRWRLWVPSELAYGDAGRADERRGQYIPPGSALQFELELLAVNGPSKPKPTRPVAKAAAAPPDSPAPPPRTASDELFEREPIARPNRTQPQKGGAAQPAVESAAPGNIIIPALRDELSDADSPLEAIWVLLMRMKPATVKLMLADLDLERPPGGADHEELVKRLVRVLQ